MFTLKIVLFRDIAEILFVALAKIVQIAQATVVYVVCALVVNHSLMAVAAYVVS